MLNNYVIFVDGPILADELCSYITSAFKDLTSGDENMPTEWTMRDYARDYIAQRVDDDMASEDDYTMDNLIDESRLTEDELRWKASHTYHDSNGPRDPESISRVELAATAIMRGFEDYWPNPDGDPDENIEESVWFESNLKKYRATRVYKLTREETWLAPAGMKDVGDIEAFYKEHPEFRDVHFIENPQESKWYEDFQEVQE